MSTKIRHLHWSGRYTLPWQAWQADIGHFFRRRKPTVATFTENRNRDKAFVQPGWEYHSRGDAAVAWKTDTWTLVGSDNVHVCPDSGYYKQSWAVLVVLENVKDKTRIIVGSWHAPVTKPGARDLADGQEVYAKGPGQIMASINNLTAKFNVKATLMAGDWNLDLANRHNRHHLEGLFPGLTPTLPENYRGPGTMAHVIDGTLATKDTAKTTVKVTRWKVLPRKGSSDHAAFLETVVVATSKAGVK